MLTNPFKSFKGGNGGMQPETGRAGSASGRIYLDNASITPVDPRVMKIVSKSLEELPANPSSLYKEGVEAKKKLEDARKRIATCLEAHADEIYFTSGGTEANNIAIQGVLAAWREQQARQFAKRQTQDEEKIKSDSPEKKPHVISTAIEHPSVMELLGQLERDDLCEVTYIEVGESGIIDPKDIKKALVAHPETALISVMYANNEVGTIQPIHEVSKVVRQFKKERQKELEKRSDKANDFSSARDFPYVHVDACQAAVYCPLRMPYLAADIMTFDGSKFYGPRSAGFMYVRRGISIRPIVYGGSQEKSLRPGTENVANALGLALALEICQAEKEAESVRVAALRDRLYSCIKEAVPNVYMNGSYGGSSELRLPNNINICLPGMDAEFAVLRLDAKGVCVSSVTSCRAQDEDSSSYVIEAMKNKDCSKSSLRITLGRYTTEKEIKKAADIFIKVLTTMI